MDLKEFSLAAVGAIALAVPSVARYDHVARHDDIRTECSLDSLGGVAALDTAKLRRRTASLPVGESTEGGEVTVFYQADRPRVVVVVYAGEMGMETVRYNLYSASAYLVEREQVRYAVPISIKSTPHVVSRLPSVVYVCGSRTLEPLADNDLRDIRNALDSSLALLRRAKK